MLQAHLDVSSRASVQYREESRTHLSLRRGAEVLERVHRRRRARAGVLAVRPADPPTEIVSALRAHVRRHDLDLALARLAQDVSRPVDVLQMRDGSVLVSDDYNGIIYRVSYKK